MVDAEKTAIAQYYHAISSGEIIACREIKAVYKHLYYKLSNTDDGFHFDYGLAQKPIEFMEKFCHLPKVRGNPLVKLMLWQRALIESIFGFVDENNIRQYTEVCLVVGRKNAKSTLAAMIGLYLLVADGEAQPELYTVATTKDQAKILWKAAIDIIHKSKDLQKYLKTRVADIECLLNGGIFKPLASESNSLDGLNASTVFLDEVHAYKDSSLYDVTVDSTAMRPQPLTLLTTTAGFQREGLYDTKLDEYERILQGYDDEEGYKDARRLPFIYKLDAKSEWTDYKAYVKANPGLGEIRSLEKLLEDVNRARANPAKQKDLLTKFFDIPQTGQDHFFSVEEATNKDTIPDEVLEKVTYGIGGYDLSQVNDLTAAVIMFRIANEPTYYVLSMAWMPEEAYERHMQEDKVPYDDWRRRGFLRTCSGSQINYHDIADWFVEMQQRYNLTLYKVGYDRYSASYLTLELEEYLGRGVLTPVAQGAKSLSIPLQAMKADFQSHKINYGNNPLFKWCLLNLMVTQDSNGNYNTVKNRNAKVRDDLAAALLDAYAALLSIFDDYNRMIDD